MKLWKTLQTYTQSVFAGTFYSTLVMVENVEMLKENLSTIAVERMLTNLGKEKVV